MKTIGGILRPLTKSLYPIKSKKGGTAKRRRGKASVVPVHYTQGAYRLSDTFKPKKTRRRKRG